MVDAANREFLFTYRFGGAEWGTSVFASDAAEAKEKIKAVALARAAGRRIADIAKSLGRTRGSVDSRLRRMKRKAA